LEDDFRSQSFILYRTNKKNNSTKSFYTRLPKLTPKMQNAKQCGDILDSIFPANLLASTEKRFKSGVIDDRVVNQQTKTRKKM